MNTPSFKNFTFAFMFCALVIPGRSQTPAGLLQVTVSSVSDSRSTGSSNSECRLELVLTGDAASDAAGVRNISITKAVDQLDRDLLSKRGNLGRQQPSFDSENSSMALKASAVLRNPSRNAAVIKVVEGNIELFTPTEDNGGVILLPGILKSPGEPAVHPQLKQNAVEIIYLTKAAMELKRKQLDEQQLKDLPGGSLGSGMASMLRDMMRNFTVTDSKNSAAFLVQDPEKRVVEIKLLDASGKLLGNRGVFTSGPMRQFNFDAPIPADAQLRVYLATPDSIKSYPFKVENVALP